MILWELRLIARRGLETDAGDGCNTWGWAGHKRRKAKEEGMTPTAVPNIFLLEYIYLHTMPNLFSQKSLLLHYGLQGLGRCSRHTPKSRMR